MQPQFKLYHYWRSSCSWRVRWALAIKKLAYTSVPINLLKNEQKQDPYLKHNPSGFVPCWQINDQSFGESMAILEWLEENYPQPSLLPQEPLARLFVRQLSYTIACGTQPLQNLKAQKYFSDEKKERLSYAQYWIKEGLDSYEKQLNNPLRVRGDFSFGQSLTFADLCLIPQCYNAERFAIDLKAYPLISQIFDNCLALDSCKETYPQQIEAEK